MEEPMVQTEQPQQVDPVSQVVSEVAQDLQSAPLPVVQDDAAASEVVEDTTAKEETTDKEETPAKDENNKDVDNPIKDDNALVMSTKAADTSVWSEQLPTSAWPGLTYSKWFIDGYFTNTNNGNTIITLFGHAQRADRATERIETALSSAKTTVESNNSKLDAVQSDVTSIKQTLANTGGVAQTVQLDSTQYAYIQDSLKISNSFCLVSFLMLCMAVGVMLASRFLGGIHRG